MRTKPFRFVCESISGRQVVFLRAVSWDVAVDIAQQRGLIVCGPTAHGTLVDGTPVDRDLRPLPDFPDHLRGHPCVLRPL